MTYTKKKKKFHTETPEERAWIDSKLNAYKKWNKAYKGEVIYKREGCSQMFVRRSKYNSREELEADAKAIVDEMSALDAKHRWSLVSAKLVGQSADDEEKD